MSLETEPEPVHLRPTQTRQARKPPMTTSPAKSAVADHILRVAGALFFREGIRAVGIDRIIGEADIAKATLYRHFSSKEDLVLAYLQDRHERVMEGLAASAAEHSGARERLAAIFDRLAEKAEDKAFRGCAFALAVAEHGDSEKIVALARLHKQAMAEALLALARDAGVAEPQAIGRHLVLLYDGALARRAVLGTPQPMHDAKDAALALIDGAPKRPSPV